MCLLQLMLRTISAQFYHLGGTYPHFQSTLVMLLISHLTCRRQSISISISVVFSLSIDLPRCGNLRA
jgi:hypothetical protein